MTDPATTIREALAKVCGYRRDEFGLFPISDTEVDTILAALTELEQQLAANTAIANWELVAEANRRAAETAERERDQQKREADRWHTRAALRETERDQLADALRAVAWKDSAGLCWCPGETEFAVAHPNGEHTPRCLAARAALDRHTQVSA